MTRSRKLTLIAALFAVTLAACIPISIPGLRNVHGQTWAARFEVEVRPGNVTTIRLPVDLALTFTQSLNDVTAEATLQYDTGLFTLQTGGLVNMQGRLGLDDHLNLQSSSNALTFEGNFVGDSLVGTVAIAGVVPVGNVTFTRVR
ncbi:MAG TPA: hypothetical protein VFN03_05030 [Trueperaceae bacterium]|jgi:hypothetical protein|nr:hypothetical protein [Trueperaceae bacterium]